MTQNRFQNLLPPHVQSLVAYDPGYEPSELKRQLNLAQMIELGSNENSRGPAVAVVSFLSSPDVLSFRYPDAGGNLLKSALSAHHGLPKAHFTLGNGTHELLTLIAETFCQPDDEVLHAQYGFAVYRLAALGAGAKPVAAAANAGLVVTPDAMLAAISPKTKLVYLANPNNPTGLAWTRAELGRFLAELPSHIVFVLDEAYIEFVIDPNIGSGIEFLADYPNLVVARTFSKAYAIAALRVGYTIADPDFANVLERTRLSFNVNSLAMRAASLAIADQARVRWIRDDTAAERMRLQEALIAMGLSIYPSQASFVLVNFARDATPIEKALVLQGVIVRPMRAYGLPTHLRITVGQRHENDALINALRVVLAELAESS